MFRGNQVGIYFSIDSIDVVESKGRRLSKYYSLAYAAKTEKYTSDFTKDDLLRMTGNLSKALREASILSKNAVLAVAAENLVIRFFQMPIIPSKELDSGVNFEARRYIPFSMEELTSNYQIIKKGSQLGVLFVAIKKSLLEFFLTVIEEAKLNLIAIEAAPFSILRALKLAGTSINDNSVIANFGSKESGNITILESGFPTFSRDIKIVSGLPIASEEGKDSISSKLLNEIRLSLDYYFRRQPYQKVIDKLIFVSEVQPLSNLKDFLSKELDLKVIAFSSADLLGKNEDVDLGLVNAFGASLRGNVNTSVSIDLLKRTLRPPKPKSTALSRATKPVSIPLLHSPVFKMLIICCLGLAFVYLTGSKKVIIEKKELDKIKSQRKNLGFYSGMNLTSLVTMQDNYKTKLASLEKLVDNRLYLTKKLNVLADILPQGCWLTEISFQRQQDSMQFKLKGKAFLDSETEELTAVNRLMANLKNETDFAEGFKEINLQYISRNKLSDWQVTDFEISCN